MMSEALEEYELSSAESVFEDPNQQAQMEFMASGGEFHYGNTSHWADQKRHTFPRSTYSDNNNWGTTAICMSVV